MPGCLFRALRLRKHVEFRCLSELVALREHFRTSTLELQTVQPIIGYNAAFAIMLPIFVRLYWV